MTNIEAWIEFPDGIRHVGSVKAEEDGSAPTRARLRLRSDQGSAELVLDGGQPPEGDGVVYLIGDNPQKAPTTPISPSEPFKAWRAAISPPQR